MDWSWSVTVAICSFRVNYPDTKLPHKYELGLIVADMCNLRRAFFLICDSSVGGTWIPVFMSTLGHELSLFSVTCHFVNRHNPTEFNILLLECCSGGRNNHKIFIQFCFIYWCCQTKDGVWSIHLNMSMSS